MRLLVILILHVKIKWIALHFPLLKLYLFMKVSIQTQLKLGEIIPAASRDGDYYRYTGI
jgi:hypothetical protein